MLLAHTQLISVKKFGGNTMGIIQSLPCSADSKIDFGTSKIIIESATRDQAYSTSSSSTVTTVGSVDLTTNNQMIIQGTYDSSFGTVDQEVVFWAVDDCTATVKRGTSSSASTSVGSYSLVAGHRYKASKHSVSSSSQRYFKLTDLTASSDLANSNSSNAYWKITFS